MKNAIKTILIVALAAVIGLSLLSCNAVGGGVGAGGGVADKYTHFEPTSGALRVDVTALDPTAYLEDLLNDYLDDVYDAVLAGESPTHVKQPNYNLYLIAKSAPITVGTETFTLIACNSINKASGLIGGKHIDDALENEVTGKWYLELDVYKIVGTSIENYNGYETGTFTPFFVNEPVDIADLVQANDLLWVDTDDHYEFGTGGTIIFSKGQGNGVLVYIDA
jgi:hypothetical protein